MASLCVKGTTIGSGRPKTIVSLMDKDEDSLVASALLAVSAGADCVEWRVDFMRDVHDPHAMAHAATTLGKELRMTPIVFTFRSAGQGGQLDLDVKEYLALNRAVLATHAVDFIDIELGIGSEQVRKLVAWAHKRRTRAIVSHHDFTGTPGSDTMERLFENMVELGADLPKLAVMAHDEVDCLRLMQATAKARTRLDVPLVSMAMGKAGTLSRLAGEICGSALTFCALGTPSAPGQVALSTALRVMNDLHEVL